MDVRCEGCQTEYELEDSSVGDGGVQVQCTACGRTFEVTRPRAASPRPMDTERSPPLAEWLLETSDGHAHRFRNLTSLQKWIIERKVTRDDKISRTGHAWKRLGEIVELAPFFDVVDEADRARAAALSALGPRQEAPAARLPPTPSAPVAVAMLDQSRRPTPPGGTESAAGPEPPPAAPPEPPAQVAASAAPVSPSPVAPAPVATPAPPPMPLPEGPEPQDTDTAITPLHTGRLMFRVLVVLLVASGVAYYGITRFYRQYGAVARGATGSAPARGAAVTAPVPPPVPGMGEELTGQVAADPVSSRDAGAKAEAVLAQEAPAGEGGPRTGRARRPAGGVARAGAAARGAGSVADVTGEPVPTASYEKLIATADRLLENGSGNRAQLLYGEALKLRPTGAEALAGLGYLALDRGRTRQAMTLFKRALDGEGAQGPAIFGLAETHRAAGDDALAVELYRRYLQEEPEGIEATAARRHIKMIEARQAVRGMPAPVVDPIPPPTQP